MQENVAAVAAAPPVGDLGFLARWAHIYFSPKKTFEAVKVRTSWVLPTVLYLLALAVATYVTTDIRVESITEKVKNSEGFSRLSAEQQGQQLEGIRSWTGKTAIVTAPLFMLIRNLVVALALWFVGNILLGGEARFIHLLGVVSYSLLIELVEIVVGTAAVLAKGSLDVTFSLAAFLPPDAVNTFLYRALNGFGIFSIWFIVMLIIGTSTIYKFSFSKVAVWVLSLYVLVKLGEAVLGSMGFGM